LLIRSSFRHWLLAVNAALLAFLLGGAAAPAFATVGWTPLADAVYAAYRLTCHQWAFRSFFLFGELPIGVVDQQRLARLGVDPFTFIGGPGLGWKMAYCERDLAIYVGLLALGLLYAARRGRLEPAGFAIYGLLIMPMALDGFSQLFGWRESTWQLRLATGLLFGLASGWLVLPRLDQCFGLAEVRPRYARSGACDPISSPTSTSHLEPAPKPTHVPPPDRLVEQAAPAPPA
jgi:uncharacterized membrane protein